MIQKTHHTLIAGKTAVSGELAEVSSPWNGKVLGQVEIATREEAELALHTAHCVAQERRYLSKIKRIEVLNKARNIITERADALALQAASEGGKPLMDSKVEIARSIDGIQSCIECLRTEHGEEIPMGITPSSANRLAMTTHEPLGVVLAYSAFNHPLNLITHQVGPAIASGCPVIIKPAWDTPLSCFTFVEILHEAGLPVEYCQAIHLQGYEVAQELVSDPRLAFFSFIGSSDVGWMLRNRLAPGVRCAMEHGGAAPIIVAADANLDECLPLIAKGGFYHAGQVCVSVQRLFVHQSIAQEVTQRLSGLAQKQKIGDPASADTEVGPLIHPASLDRVDQWVKEAVADGAQLICGGNKLPNNSYECTVLLDPPDSSKVSRNEIFGPVICIYSYDNIDTAMERANQLPFCFQAAVISSDIDTAMYCFNHLNAAAVFVNDQTAFRVDWMPFAGYRESGYGTGGIRYTFHDMQLRKLLVLRSKNL